MVATGISQQSQRCCPRFQDDRLQAKIMRDALAYLVCFQITVNHIHIAHRQPINISCHLHRNVHNGTTDSYLYFLNLIEKKHTQLLVETIEIQHLLESCSFFILMRFLRNFQERVHIGRKAIVPDALQIPYRFGFIRNDKSTTFQQSHQVCLCHIMFREVR